MNAVRWVAAALVLALLMLTPATAAAQGCAMCRTVGSGANDPLVKGMFRSVMFMISVPVLLVLGVGGWLTYHLRRESHEVLGPSDDGPDTRIIEFRRRET